MAMRISEVTIKWLVWLVLSTMAATSLGYVMLSETTDKTLFMPGALSPGHHQLAQACGACHLGAFAGGEVLQQACVDCHGKDRVKPVVKLQIYSISHFFCSSCSLRCFGGKGGLYTTRK